MNRKQQGAEILRLYEKEKKSSEERRKMMVKIQMFTKKTDKFIEECIVVIDAYPKMLKTNPELFSNHQNVAGILNKLEPRILKYMGDYSAFNDKYIDFLNLEISYLKDSKDLSEELKNQVKIDNNLFTKNSYQVMRLPELKTKLEEMYYEYPTLEKEMNAIEKVIASIRIPAN